MSLTPYRASRALCDARYRVLRSAMMLPGTRDGCRAAPDITCRSLCYLPTRMLRMSGSDIANARNRPSGQQGGKRGVVRVTRNIGYVSIGDRIVGA
eukprot:259552-Rhodomonas_salina.1